MVSLVVYGLLALIVAAIVVAVLVLVLPDDTVAPPLRDTVPGGLPDGDRVEARDVRRLRLPVGLRGYRMTETDAVLDRLGAELASRDEEIARLRGSAAPDADPTGSEQYAPGAGGGPPAGGELLELGETPEESEDRPPGPDRPAGPSTHGETTEVASWDPASAQR